MRAARNCSTCSAVLAMSFCTSASMPLCCWAHSAMASSWDFSAERRASMATCSLSKSPSARVRWAMAISRASWALRKPSEVLCAARPICAAVPCSTLSSDSRALSSPICSSRSWVCFAWVSSSSRVAWASSTVLATSSSMLFRLVRSFGTSLIRRSRSFEAPSSFSARDDSSASRSPSSLASFAFSRTTSSVFSFSLARLACRPVSSVCASSRSVRNVASSASLGPNCSCSSEDWASSIMMALASVSSSLGKSTRARLRSLTSSSSEAFRTWASAVCFVKSSIRASAMVACILSFSTADLAVAHSCSSLATSSSASFTSAWRGSTASEASTTFGLRFPI
mmetsp:Transcript_1234/g.3505  ORF Transcript_1234/g.3505 Transcript_1234/m.3505 type:complete len:339 (+) Transcript_1234:436-1452(+)